MVPLQQLIDIINIAKIYNRGLISLIPVAYIRYISEQNRFEDVWCAQKSVGLCNCIQEIWKRLQVSKFHS